MRLSNFRIPALAILLILSLAACERAPVPQVCQPGNPVPGRSDRIPSQDEMDKINKNCVSCKPSSGRNGCTACCVNSNGSPEGQLDCDNHCRMQRLPEDYPPRNSQGELGELPQFEQIRRLDRLDLASTIVAAVHPEVRVLINEDELYTFLRSLTLSQQIEVLRRVQAIEGEWEELLPIIREEYGRFEQTVIEWALGWRLNPNEQDHRNFIFFHWLLYDL